MDAAFATYKKFMESKVHEFISELSEQYNIPEDLLLEVWAKIARRQMEQMFGHTTGENTSGKVTKSKPEGGCQAILKSGHRRTQTCGNNISLKSKSGRFCTTHVKLENTSECEPPIDESEGVVFKKNKWGNYAFGDTGLILKAQDDQRIIGKQKPDGAIIDLTEDDMKLCKRRRLAYVPNYHANLIQQAPSDSANTITFTSQIAFL